MNLSRRLKMALFAGVASLTLGGCMVSAEPAARVTYYRDQPYRDQPVYYDGYVVHYDSAGPYVYMGRTPRYVPRHHPRYSEIARRAPRRYRRYYD
jgi:hypothetical protein